MEKIDKTLINVLGAARSGTTMLDLMLGNDEESFSLGEVNAWFRPFRTHHFRISCNCGDPRCEYWSKIKNYNENEFHKKAFEELNVNFLIDSSKDLDWVIDNNHWALQHDVKVVNILLYKPFKEYAHSIWKRGKSIDEALSRYKLYYSRFFETQIPAYSINYKSLVENPESTLGRLCELSEQKSYPERKKFWDQESHHLFGSGGVRKQMRKGDPGIKSTVYKDHFLDLWTEFIERLQHDSLFNEITNQLQNIDALNNPRRPLTFNEIQKPWWYYYLKGRNKFKSIFPETLKSHTS